MRKGEWQAICGRGHPMVGPGSDVYLSSYRGRVNRRCRQCARIRKGSLPHEKRYSMRDERKRIKKLLCTIAALKKAANDAPVTVFGKTQTEAEWCEEFGLTVGNLRTKLKKGQTYLEALTCRKSTKKLTQLYCRRGHMQITGNVYVSKSGKRHCRVCHQFYHQRDYVPASPRTHCRNGHDYSVVGVYKREGKRRRCRECTKNLKAKRSKGEGRQPANAVKTHCKRGHPFSKDNTWFNQKKGTRRCRECHRASNRKVGI